MDEDDQDSAHLPGGGQPSGGGPVEPAANLRGGGTATAYPGSITITTILWFTWVEIAIEQAYRRSTCTSRDEAAIRRWR